MTRRTHVAPLDFRSFGWLPILLLGLSLAPPTTQACVGPPPEPVCTKSLALAIAGPPTVLLPGGGVFDIEALLYFSLIDFPEGTGSCPVGPYAVDVSVTATCSPAGANGSGQLLGAAITTGYNELTVPITVPAGPPRACVLEATATLTLLDGMVLTDTADSVACLAEPAPGNPNLPRLSVEIIGGEGAELARVHPGDPASRTFRITNNDPTETFIGLLDVDMINESRQPGSSGPMPEGTAVVSVSDPVEGDNFPIEVLLGDFAVLRGDPVIDACLELPPDPTDPEISTDDLEIVVGPGFDTVVTVNTRPWGLCADGSCGRSTLNLDGTFSDFSAGLACTGFVAAVDTSVTPKRACDDSGRVVVFPPPPDPSQPELPFFTQARLGFLLQLLIALAELQVEADGQPVGAMPSFFSEHFNDFHGQIQAQYVLDLGVNATFDVSFEIDIDPDTGGLPAETELLALPLIDAPTGFEGIAPFVEARVGVTDVGSGLRSTTDLAIQLSAVGIDDLFDRRRLTFDNVSFVRKPDGSGLIGTLQGGSVEPGAGSVLQALEVVLALRGFASPEPQGVEIFTDGFESGNVTRWSRSVP